MEIQEQKEDQSITKIDLSYMDKEGVIGSIIETPITGYQRRGSILYKGTIHMVTPDKWEMKGIIRALKSLKGLHDCFEIGVSGNDMIYKVKFADENVSLDFNGKFSLSDHVGDFMNIYNTEYFLQILKHVDTSSIAIGLQDGMPIIVKDNVNTFALAPRMRE